MLKLCVKLGSTFSKKWSWPLKSHRNLLRPVNPSPPKYKLYSRSIRDASCIQEVIINKLLATRRCWLALENLRVHVPRATVMFGYLIRYNDKVYEHDTSNDVLYCVQHTHIYIYIYIYMSIYIYIYTSMLYT